MSDFVFHVFVYRFFFSLLLSVFFFYFFFNDTATTEIYTLSLHDALPISWTPSLSNRSRSPVTWVRAHAVRAARSRSSCIDRKSTRLNSSHLGISYAVFCLKKKKKKKIKQKKSNNNA